MNDIIKLYLNPELNSPKMIAVWPGIGNVSTLVASYLRKKLSFEKLGEIESAYFFDPIGVNVRDNVVKAPQFPQNQLFYWKNSGEGSDIILFLGEDQPPTKAYELANCILDVADNFQVERIYTLAAALTRIHYTEQPKVWGAASSQQLITVLQEYDLQHRGNLQIAGLNGLLLGVAKEREIEGICLLAEVPANTGQLQNPTAALAILQVLTTMLDIEIDTSELVQLASDSRESLKQMASEAMGEYIDLFTEPIWEQGANEEN